VNFTAYQRFGGERDLFERQLARFELGAIQDVIEYLKQADTSVVNGHNGAALRGMCQFCSALSSLHDTTISAG